MLNFAEKWAPQMFELSLLQLSVSCSSVIDVSVIVSSSAVGLLTRTLLSRVTKLILLL